MTIELGKDGYGIIMAQVQKVEELAWGGIFPSEAPGPKDQSSYKKFQDIVSELRNLRGIIQENLFIVPKAAGPDGPQAA